MESSGVLLLVSFLLQKEEFAVDILCIREIIRLVPVTKVPDAPRYIGGIINLRGKIIPVIDLRIMLNLPEKVHDKNTRIVVVEVMNKTWGFIVDAVLEVLRVPAEIIEAPASMISDSGSEYIKGIGKLNERLLILLDLEILLSAEKEKYPA